MHCWFFSNTWICQDLSSTPKTPMYRWNVVRIPLERNPKDTREESWKIQGSRGEWNDLHRKIHVQRQLGRREWISLLQSLHERFGVGCVQELNERRLSIGMIRPVIQGFRFEDRGEKYDASVQTTLDSIQQFLTIKNYKEQPRITYRCGEECKARNAHDQQLLEWGAYEWMRNHSDNKDQLWENLMLNDSESDIQLTCRKPKSSSECIHDYQYL